MNIDEFIEHAKEKAREHRYHADFFESDNPMNTACIKSAEDCEQLAEWLEKSKEYLDLEEQGLLLRLPVPIGTTVYNTTWWDDKYEIVTVNGKKYSRSVRKHKVTKSTFGLLDIKEWGKTVFLTKSEAEQKLKEMESELYVSTSDFI